MSLLAIFNTANEIAKYTRNDLGQMWELVVGPPENLVANQSTLEFSKLIK